jgi:polyketide synthase PksN
MGGDSINATRLVREINKEYSGLANVADVFSYPTIADMAEYLNKMLEKGTAAESTDDIDSILDKLMEGEISVGNAQALIEKAGEKEWIK